MIKNYIITSLKENFQYSPTNSQLTALHKAGEFIADTDTKSMFLLKGYAGTGKTTLVNAVVNTLNEHHLKSVLLAPTGRAAKMLNNYSGKEAYTIHKKIYRQQSSSDGFGNFSLDRNLHTNTIFIVDEASMITNQGGNNAIFGSGKLLDDLITYVYSQNNCKLMLIGDTAQLPPVGLSISPALDRDNLKTYSEISTLYTVTLTDVIRQSFNSGILYNATKIREMIPDYAGKTFPKFEIAQFNDITKISGNDLIEKLSDVYSKDLLQNTIVICRSNKRANQYNQGIRNAVLWQEEEITSGDLVMIVKNNYFWGAEEGTDFIANGDIAEITHIRKFEELYGFRFADVTINFLEFTEKEIDAKIILDTLHTDAPALTYQQNRQLYDNIAEDYPEKNKRERFKKIRSNPYFNALQIKFSYAVTCHKAQGGQWHNVFIDHGFIKEDMLNREFLRWLYTSLTRAQENSFLINFKPEFFDEEEDEYVIYE